MSPQPAFTALASEVARVRSRLGGTLLALPDAASGGSGAAPHTRAALRVRRDAAATLLPLGDSGIDTHLDLLVADRASGLAIVRVPDGGPSTGAPVPWAPVQLAAPRFLMMATGSAHGLSLQPVFVGALSTLRSPAWSGPVWLLPSGTPIPAGALLFTGDGELVGLSVEEEGGLAIVPGETLLADAQRLLDRGEMPEGDLGLAAQALTEVLAAASGAGGGVVVTWVAPDGPAARQVWPGDVVETINGAPIRTLREWQVLARRVSAGEVLALEIRRGGELQPVEIVAAPADMPPERSLGLALRFVTDVGSEVVRVEPGSAAEAAGIVRGDIITVIGTAAQPTPARIRLAFASTEETTPLLVALTRGDSHHVTALAR
jgi:hypothetical protein